MKMEGHPTRIEQMKMEGHRTRIEQLRRMAPRFLSNPLTLTAILVLSLVCVVILCPQRLAPYEPYKIVAKEKLQPPSRLHLFGTDEFGRDVLSRAIYGARPSVLTAVTVVIFACTVGTVVGSAAGYGGPLADAVIMRIVDIMLAFPALVLAMAIVTALGRGLMNAMIAIVLIWWGQYARLVRGQVLQIKEKVYVDAALAIGVPPARILIRHILPNCVSVILVKCTLDVALAILFTAFMSFLGLGVQPPQAEWGADVSTGRHYLLDAWWYPTFPGLSIFVTVMALNLFGDALRDVLDVKLQGSA
jgi:peptide/nickel transport system permease protein